MSCWRASRWARRVTITPVTSTATTRTSTTSAGKRRGPSVGRSRMPSDGLSDTPDRVPDAPEGDDGDDKVGPRYDRQDVGGKPRLVTTGRRRGEARFRDTVEAGWRPCPVLGWTWGRRSDHALARRERAGVAARPDRRQPAPDRRAGGLAQGLLPERDRVRSARGRAHPGRRPLHLRGRRAGGPGRRRGSPQ